MKKLILLVFVAVFATYARAQSWEAGAFMHRYPSEFNGVSFVYGGYIDMTLDKSLGSFRFKSTPRLRYESLSNEGGTEDVWGSEHRGALGLTELYIELDLKPFKIGVGKRKTQNCLLEESPTCPEDAWSPHDFIDPLPGFEEVLGVGSLWAKLYGDAISLEAMYSPRGSVSRFPYEQKDRWYALSGVPLDSMTHSPMGDKLEARLTTRLNSSLLSLSLYNGSDYQAIPGLTPSGGVFSLEYVYPERFSLIGGFAHYGDFIKRLTLGYTKTGGVERIEFGGELELQSLSYYGSRVILLGVLGSVPLDSLSLEASNPASLRYGWNNTIYGGVELEFDDWTLRFPLALVDLSSFVVLPELKVRTGCESFVCSYFELGMRMMILGGGEETFLGQYASNERLEVFLKIGL